MKRRAVLALTAFSLLGCTAFFAALSTIGLALSTAESVIAAIQSFVDTYFRAHANDSLRAKIDLAMTKTREALLVAMQAAKTAKDVHDVGLQLALADFQELYRQLLELVGPIGVVPAASVREAVHATNIDHASGAEVPVLIVPTAKSLVEEVR